MFTLSDALPFIAIIILGIPLIAAITICGALISPLIFFGVISVIILGVLATN